MQQIMILALAAALAIVPGAANSETSTPTTAAEPEQKIKCRKVQMTGSLIRKGKICRTVAEWKRLQQLGNDHARTLAGEHLCMGPECRGIEPPRGG